MMAAISQIVSGLPAKIPDLAERAFLSETLNCYRVRAYRAAIIMAWNLPYDHIVRRIFADHGRLQRLNSRIRLTCSPFSYPNWSPGLPLCNAGRGGTSLPAYS